MLSAGQGGAPVSQLVDAPGRKQQGEHHDKEGIEMPDG